MSPVSAIMARFTRTARSRSQENRSRNQPKWLRIGGYWYPRGGIPIDVFCRTGRLPKGMWIPDQGVAPIAGGDENIQIGHEVTAATKPSYSLREIRRVSGRRLRSMLMDVSSE